MTTAIVQTTQATSGDTATFSDDVTAGNTVILVTTVYGNGSLSTSDPTFGASTPAGSVLLFSQQTDTGSDDVLVAAWMMPDLAGGSADIGISFSGSGSAGIVGYEISGLGASPFLDQSSGASSTADGVSSGTTPAILYASEIIIGGTVAYGVTGTPSGSPWTNQNNLPPDSGYTWAGYQLPGSAGGTFSYGQSYAGTINAAAFVATVAPQQIVSAAAPVPADDRRTNALMKLDWLYPEVL